MSNVKNVFPQDFAKLAEGTKPLNIKFGCDPTKPDLHLGHAIVLEALQKYQKMGHVIHFIIGDFTTQIGDPTGKNEVRPMLTREEVLDNAKTYMDQVFLYLDKEKTVVHYNSDWFNKMSPIDFLKLFSCASLAQVLAREDFSTRFSKKGHISMHELLYPMLQGYDSVAIGSDLEVGGDDQLFNLLMGREIQKKFGQEPQGIITYKLLLGLDGTKKMSKSYNNYIALTDKSEDVFGKVMSIDDRTMEHYYEMFENIHVRHLQGKDARDKKQELAWRMTAKLHGQEQADIEIKKFKSKFAEKSDVSLTEITLEFSHSTADIVDVICKLGLAKSVSQSRRLIEQKAVRINRETVLSHSYLLNVPGKYLIKVGKKNIFQLFLIKKI